MKAILEIAGLLCLVQAVGGALNNLTDGSPSWFLVNHVALFRGYEIFASIALGVLGVALWAAGRSIGRAREKG
ncbi:hypothetical protein [Spongiactinospora sp. TRM90649]|uniref:hypothetical protein n=1 Tax=Spongiactinospora sp. TRM90649 TaxID=3031114 RepID=UPI0023F8EB7A|nr:hypothetical protein [Spongiactinospora sp. TRM90649]MDF5758484.1 hypothetical protein [Spongiactinospora sp. TRM90649]